MTSSINPDKKVSLPEQLVQDFQASKVQEQAFIDERSWLKKGHPLGKPKGEMDWSVFAHLNGDGIIQGTPLEGSTPETSTSFFRDFIDKLLQNPPLSIEKHRSKLNAFRTELTRANEISTHLTAMTQKGKDKSIREREEMVEDYARALSQEFKGKKAGWIPCGWRTKSGQSHAMMARIDIENGSVTLVNTGGGVDKNHPIIKETLKDPLTGEVKEELKCQEFVKISGIDEARLRDPLLFQFLIELNTRSAWDGLLDFNSDNIYEPLKNYLNGTAEKALSPFDHPEVFKKPQRSGTCAFKSVTTSLYYHLCDAFDSPSEQMKEDVECYKQIKYLWQTQALVSIAEGIDGTLTEPQSLLLEDVMQNVARAAEKLHIKNLLKDEDLQNLNATLLDIRNRISHVRVVKEEVEISQPLPIAIHREGPVAAEPFAVDTSDLLYARFEEGRRGLGRALTTHETILSNLETHTGLYSQRARETKSVWASINAFKDEFNSVVELYARSTTYIDTDLKRELEYLNSENRVAFRESLLKKLAQFISELPSPSREEGSFWNQVSKDEIVPLMASINQLMTVLHAVNQISNRSWQVEDEHDADTTAMIYTLLAINTQLAMRVPEANLDNFHINYYDLVYEIKSPHFTITNSKLQEQLDKVLHYFDPSFTLDQLVKPSDLSKEAASLFSFKTDKQANITYGFVEFSDDQPNSYSQETIAYYAQRLKVIKSNPHLLKKLYKRGKVKEHVVEKQGGSTYYKAVARPLTEADSVANHIIALITDPMDGDSLIHPSVHMLRQTSLHCLFHVSRLFPLSDYIGNKNHIDLEYRSSGEEPPTYYVSPKGFSEGSKKSKDIQDDHLKKEKLFDEALIKNAAKRIRQNTLIVRQNIQYDQSLDTSRELEMLGVDPFDQASRVVAFIQKQVHLLKDPKIQHLLKMHLFSVGRISSQLKDEPNIAKNLSVALQRAIKHYCHEGDIETCLFLAKMGNDFRGFARKFGADGLMQDYRKVILEEILPHFTESLTCKLQAYEAVVSLYAAQDPWDEKEAVLDVLRLSIIRGLHGNYGDPNKSFDTTARSIQQRVMSSKVESMMKEQSFRNTTLNGLLHLVNSGAEQQIWSDRFPVYESARYIIDIKEGSVVDKQGGKLCQVPQTISQSDLFKAIYKDPIISCEKRNDTTYIINSGCANEIIVTIIGGIQLEFQKKIDGVNYRYTNPAKFKNLIPTLVNEQTQFWAHDGDKPEMIGFVEGTKRALHIELKKGGKPGDYKISKVYRYKNDGQIDRTQCHIPFSKVNRSLEFLQKLLPADKIECWSKNEELSELHMKELSLDFIAKEAGGHKSLYCQQFPGYFLVENPEIPALMKTPLFITLQNMAGERKILVPQVPIETEFNKEPFDRTLKQMIPNKFQWLEYEIKDGDLHSNKVEAQLYMMSLWASRGDYDKTFNLLKEITPLERLVDNPEEEFMERTTLKGILAELIKDKHPSAQSMLLHLVLFIHKNNLKYPLAIGAPEDEELFNFDLLCSAYVNYDMSKTNTTTTRLSVKQEQIIIELIYKGIETDLKNASGLKEILEKQVKKMKLDILYGTRREQLRTGRAKIGSRTFSIPEIGAEGKPLRKYQIVNKFEEYCSNEAYKDFKLPGFCIQESGFFEANFANLYKIATSEDAKQIERLQIIMDMSSKCRSDPYYRFIADLLKKPSSYPSFSSLEEATKNYLTAKKERSSFKWSGPGTTEEKDAAYQIISAKYDEADKARDNITGVFYEYDTLFIIIKNFVKKIFAQFIIPLYQYIFPPKFTFGTRVREILKGWFGSKTDLGQRQNATSRTLLKCDGKSLVEADKALDQYFATVLDKYFDCQVVPVDINGGMLPEDHKDKNVQRKLKKENEELKTYKEGQPKTKNIYSLKGGVSFEGLQQTMQETAGKLQTTLKTQKAALLWQLNDIPDHVKERSLKSIHNVGFAKRATWNDLRKLTLKGDIEAFQKKTHLGEEEAKRLMLGVSDYLVRHSRLEQMQLVLANVKKAHAERNPLRKDLIAQTVASALIVVRGYEPSIENRDKQWFEFANHYLYREIQLTKLKEISDNGSAEVLAEMPTGFGKTKALIPSADYEKMTEGKVVFNTWPSSLEMTNALDIKEQMKTSYGKKVDRFTFDRASSFTTESLKTLYEELVADKKKGIPINVRSESLRALQLHAVLCLNHATATLEDPTELNEQIGYFLKILRLMRTSGWTSIDESHVNLDPLDKLIYTIGDPEILPTKDLDLLEEFFDILTEEEFDKVLHIKDNLQSLVNEEVYTKEIAPKLAKRFAEKFKVAPENMKSYEDFVLGSKGELPDWLKVHAKKDSIALVKGLLSQVFKSSIKGSVDMNYGLSKLHIDKKEYAISYLCANTPKESKSNPSQFKNPHETMSKTFMTYLHKGLSEKQVGKLIDFLKMQAKTEAEDGMSIDETSANKFFQEIAPGSKKLLTKINKRDIKALTVELSKNKKAVFFYIKQIIAPQLKIYPEHLESTVHNYRTQFASSLSLSATPQDTATHGPDTVFIPMKGTSGQVTHLLLTKCKDPKTLHKLEQLKPSDVLEETLDHIIKPNPRIKATIDIGGLYKGISNHQVAEKMREKFMDADTAEAILFFDEKEGIFKIMDIATGKIHDPSESKVDPELIQTHYDQSRCFGSDLKLAVDAVGLLMTGVGTTKANAGQGAGRMRQWHQTQSVEVAYPGAIENDIFGDQSPTIKGMLVYWIANQAKLEADKNYQSQMQQMDNEIRTSLFDKILGLSISGKNEDGIEEPDVDDAIQNFEKYKKVFFATESCNPWNMYAAIPEEKDALLCLEDYQKNCLEKIKHIDGISRGEKDYIRSRLEKYPSKWKDMALPEKVKANVPGLGLECEVLQEVEVETQIEVQAHVHEQVVERAPRTWPENLNLFQPGWEKPTRENLTLRKMGLKITQILPKHPVAKVFSVIGMGTAVSAVVTGTLLAVSLLVSAIAWPIIAAVGAGLFLLGIGAAIGSLFIGRNLTKGNPIYRIADLMTMHLPSNVQAGAQLFSSNLLASHNFYAQSTDAAKEPAQSPLNIEQKPIFSILVIMDEHENGNTEVKAMVVDQNDSIFFHKKLKEDRENSSTEDLAGRKRKVGLYDIHNGMFTVQGANKFDEKDLKNPDLQSMIGQVKFLNGEIKYEEAELEHFGARLDKVAKDVGYGPLQSLFLDKILQYRPVNKKCLINKVNPKPIAQRLGLAATV